jgi:hypothetical protein
MLLHMGIAGATKFDDFALEKQEADTLSLSIANVMDQFDWTPDPRFTAIAGLVSTSALIYGPRVYLYREHLKAKVAEKKAGKGEEANGAQYGSLVPAGIGAVQ